MKILNINGSAFVAIIDKEDLKSLNINQQEIFQRGMDEVILNPIFKKVYATLMENGYELNVRNITTRIFDLNGNMSIYLEDDSAAHSMIKKENPSEDVIDFLNMTDADNLYSPNEYDKDAAQKFLEQMKSQVEGGKVDNIPLSKLKKEDNVITLLFDDMSDLVDFVKSYKLDPKSSSLKNNEEMFELEFSKDDKNSDKKITAGRIESLSSEFNGKKMTNFDNFEDKHNKIPKNIIIKENAFETIRKEF